MFIDMTSRNHKVKKKKGCEMVTLLSQYRKHTDIFLEPSTTRVGI